MTGTYDYRLVALSVLIAVCASYAALDYAARITAAAAGRARMAWLAGGATAMGIGIWSMHYIGMLAFHLPVPVLYDWPTVLLSLFAAIFASAVALFVVSRKNMSWRRASVGSAIMGGGIAAMHYIGMAAMRLPATYSYSRVLVTLSVAFAILISLVAIWLAFRFREETQGSLGRKIVGAVIMGAAIPVMHYTGMAAARFSPSDIFPGTAHAVSTSILGFTGVTSVTLLVLGVAVITAAVDRRFSAQALQLDAIEKRYQSLVEGVKDYAIFLLTPDGYVSSWNQGAERIEGYTAGEIIGRHFSCFYSEEDVRNNKPQELLNCAIKEGKVEYQGWRVRKDGSKFWAEVAISPLWDTAGRLQGFSKVARDITEHKRAEQQLRELSGRLLQVQDAERRRIARELHDSAGQLITALGMNLAPLERQAQEINPSAATLVKESMRIVGELSKEVRTVSYLLHPPLLDELGLSSTLRNYVEGFAERSKIQIDLAISDDFNRLPRELEITLFRIVQESLTNIHRHSGSATARIRLFRRGTDVHLEVQDEGKGIPATHRGSMNSVAKTGVGIQGMRERLRQLGGSLDIMSGPDSRGTLLVVLLPIPNDAAISDSQTEPSVRA